MLGGQLESDSSLEDHPTPTPIKCPMSKKQKLSSKRSRASEELTHDYDHEKFVNDNAAEKFDLISKNRSFIKEKGFHHPDDFFRKTIANKGWRALCQPLRPATTSVVREFYANLASHVLKRVRVRGVLVDFSAESINRYYNLELVNSEAYCGVPPFISLQVGPTHRYCYGRSQLPFSFASMRARTQDPKGLL